MRVLTARLKPDMIALYERLHAEMEPDRHRAMLAAGYRVLDIYRDGVLLVMLMDHRPEEASPGHAAEADGEDPWHEITGRCLEQGWHDLSRIFALDATC